MHTFEDINGYKRECSCNSDTHSLILDYENEKIYCMICGDTALMPSYFDLLTQRELYEFYTNPKKKVYDFGTNGISVPANAQVINYVRGHLGLPSLL